MHTEDEAPHEGTEHAGTAPELDMDEINAEISTGVRALTALQRHAGDDWNRWSAVIVGFRALRSLAFAQSGTNSITSWHYRQAMGALLRQRKYAIYDSALDKQTRSTCYKLMNRIEDIDAWYAGLPASDKLRWKHPDAIAKHCPRHLLEGGMRGHNKPPPNKLKPAVSVETERLKALLIRTIKLLMKYEPETATALLDEIMPAGSGGEPSDALWGPGGADPGDDPYAPSS